MLYHEYDEAQAEALFAGTAARGGANSFLWIWEWGFVGKDLRCSEEILTGASPSAKDGIVIVETSWRGGLVGTFGTSSRRRSKRPRSRNNPMIGVVFFRGRMTRVIVMRSRDRSPKKPCAISRISLGSVWARCPGINGLASNTACS